MTDPAYLQVNEDRPYLEISPDTMGTLTWDLLKQAANEGIPLMWDMMGERRMLPVQLLADTWRVIEGYLDLLKLGRGTEAHLPKYFVRDQTVPLPPAVEPRASSIPVCQRT